MNFFLSFLLSFFSLSLIFPSTYSDDVTKSILTWSRQLQTCDIKDDLEVPLSGTTRFIYAVNDNNLPTSDNGVSYHNWRGTKNVNLMDESTSSSRPSLPSDAANMTIMSDPYPIPTVESASTYYHCQGFKRNFDQKVHVVKFTPQIKFENSMLVHHILLFLCPAGLDSTDLAFKGNCYGTPKIPSGLAACDQQRLAAAWAVGGGEMVLPPAAGYPVPAGDSYFMLQIHYHNPNLMSAIDSAGFALTYTKMLRDNDAAALEIEIPLSTINIPAKKKNHTVVGMCPAGCQVNFPTTGLNIYGSMLHTHLAGVSVRVEHLRNGVALPHLDDNLYYDFNYQQVVTFPVGSKTILNGDEMRLTCTYNTMSRTSTTRGGLATTDEMCIAYLFYYPADKNPSKTYTRCYTRETSPNLFDTQCNNGGNLNFRGVQYQIDTPLPQPICTPSPQAHPYTNGNAGTTFVQPNQIDLSSYSKSAVLDDNGKYVLYWNISQDPVGSNGIISFAVEVATSGWIGLGISPSGSMWESDSVMGWVNPAGGQVYLTDRINTVYVRPTIDESQDIFNVKGTQGPYPLIPPPFNPIYYLPGTYPDTPTTDSSTTGSKKGLIIGVAISLVIFAIVALVIGIWAYKTGKCACLCNGRNRNQEMLLEPIQESHYRRL